MQIGSLGKCVNDNFKNLINEDILPMGGCIYTIRDFPYSNGIRLEEIVNPIRKYGNKIIECSFNVEAFKEVQPPMNVSEMFADQLKINKTESKPIKAPKARKKRTN